MTTTKERVEQAQARQAALLIRMTEVGQEMTRLDRISGAILLNAVERCRSADCLQARADAGDAMTQLEDLTEGTKP